MPSLPALALVVAWSLPGLAGAAGPTPAWEQAGTGSGDSLAYRTCPAAGPVDYGVTPAQVRCTNGPVTAGTLLAHGFGFPAPGFSGRITSTLVGDGGSVRTFTCSTTYAVNAPALGLVSPSISCAGSGPFPFGQVVTQTCTVEGLAPVYGGGSGLASAGAWTCYLGA